MKLKTIPEYLLALYRKEDISFEELAVKLNVSRPTLTKFFKNNNLKTNKVLKRNKIKHDYFNNIDSKEKAYVLGYYIADGCITIKKNKYSFLYSMQFSCTKSDVELLELIKKELCLPNKIHISKKRYKAYNENYTSKPMCSLSVVSELICKKLCEYGIGYNKTYKSFSFPKIPLEYKIYLLLGYFDGDGSLVISKGKRNNGYNYINYNFSITAKTNLFLEGISLFLKETYNIKSYVNYEHKRDVYVFRITSKKDILLLKDLFYKNNNLGLKRKKDKFMGIPC